MFDSSAFVLELHVLCDNFCKAHRAWKMWAPSPGPAQEAQDGTLRYQAMDRCSHALHALYVLHRRSSGGGQ